MRLTRILPATQVTVLTPGMCKLEAPGVQMADICEGLHPPPQPAQGAQVPPWKEVRHEW